MKRYIFIIPLLSIFLSGCKQEELLKGLEQKQANEVIALLQRNNISAEKKEISKEGFSVSVGPRDFSAAVDLMSKYGMPHPADIEIAQMFPSDSLVSSPRAEKARLYSGIEQRLSQSLLLINGVVTARVHVSYDMSSDERERKESAVHLSALVNFDSRVSDPALLITDIKRFLKNSFNNIDYDNVSVVLSQVDNVQRTPPTFVSPKNTMIVPFVFLFLILIGIGIFLLLAKNSRARNFYRDIKKRSVKANASNSEDSVGHENSTSTVKEK